MLSLGSCAPLTLLCAGLRPRTYDDRRSPFSDHRFLNREWHGWADDADIMGDATMGQVVNLHTETPWRHYSS